MKKFSKICLALLTALPMWQAQAANNDPIVLVNGFAGWGRDELLGYKYWGGFYDIQEELKAKGHMTYTAAVGPFSSNWDRAAELYAQMTGTCTDYGAAHAAKFGIARFGRCFEKDVSKNPAYVAGWDANHKVHLIAHSQGAQTTRMLVQLLEEGSQEERGASGAAVSPLFQGGKVGWVRSVSTIAGANNGTSLGIVVPTLLPDIVAIVGGIAATAGVDTSDKKVYDFKLDQFGLQRNDGESLVDYAKRVNDSPVFKNSKNTALTDLDPDGAKEINAWVKTRASTYYFSFSNDATTKGLLTDYQYPDVSANLVLQPLELALGTYSRNETGKVVIDKSWYQNDGITNTISHRVPTGHATVNYVAGSVPAKGTWNYMGHWDGWEHFDVIGQLSDKSKTDVLKRYFDHVALLKTLN